MDGEGMVARAPGLIERSSVLERISAAGLSEDEVGYLWMDDTLGLLLDKLDELGIADNTIFVFTADNGGSPITYSLTNNGNTLCPSF